MQNYLIRNARNILSIPNIIRLSRKNMQIGTYKFALKL